MNALPGRAESATTSKAELAIVGQLGVPPDALADRHQPCPMCGSTDRYRFDDKHGNGEYYCNGCGAGNGLTLVQKYFGLDFVAALNRVEDVLGFAPVQVTEARTMPSSDRMRALLQKTWEDAKPVEPGDAVASYLANRGLALPAYPKVLRTHAALGYYRKEGKRSKLVGKFPAMLAKLHSVDRKPVTLHRTYLGNGVKATVPCPKKLFSSGIKGAAVRLFEPDRELALAEGIETALAVHLQTGLPVWAAGSAGNLETVEIPQAVTKVTVFADSDESYRGQAAAYALAHRLSVSSAKRSVVVYVPRNSGTDFLDVYNARKRLAT